ncbi:signal peptidase I [Halorubrum sp. CBA1229]|uniref:signal peptidase I n=1 Tax=Halorubrum sp. CBA1229 TaxID=1853699 RepID=UPI000F3C7669|nr:signal peptidase I [Halorubrum sp. CBA1229]QKY18066.1 signal peptidase I [Halorubrum sp. CBA1229]
MPDTRRLLSWLGLLLLIAIVIPFVIYAVPGVVGAEGSYVVLSGSMEPTINTGDVVVVDDVDPADIEERDVITYLRSGSDTPTTHRVVGINEDGGERSFVTQGDANDDPDASPVAASEVRGQVVFTIPYIGYVIQFGSTTTGFVALVVVPFALLLLSEVYSIVVDGSESDDEGSDETKAVTAADPDVAGPEPAVRRPVHTPTVAGTNGQRAASEAADEEAEDGGGIALTRTDLRLSLGVLTGTAVYAGWVVYNIQAAWSFAVAFGSGIGALLVGSMYYAAGSDDAPESETTSDTGSVPALDPVAVTGSTPAMRADGSSMPSPEHAGIESADHAESEADDA